jgi:hypothetical protein
MGATTGSSVSYVTEIPSWVARLRRENGLVVGGGVLLPGNRVLTCAHVVTPGGRFLVELIGCRGRLRSDDFPRVWATVTTHVPPDLGPDRDASGDLALLALDTPQPQEWSTCLHRLSSSQREVVMYGFPEGHDGGLWLQGQIVGTAGADGRVQLNPRTPEQKAVPGFSGAGVVDTRTGAVIGIALTVSRIFPFCFMSPAETITRHLPGISGCVRGPIAVDRTLVTATGEEGVDLPFAERLADWLKGRGYAVKISVVAADDSARAETLRRTIALADRELHSTGPAQPIPGLAADAAPPVGGLDLAIDVTGCSTDEISSRVAERLGLDVTDFTEATRRVRAYGLALGLVVVGVDRAVDPAGLIHLFGGLLAQDSRLLLVFRDEHADSLRLAETELVVKPWNQRIELLADRLTALLDGPGVKLQELSHRFSAGAEVAGRDLEEAYRVLRALGLLGPASTDPGPWAKLQSFEETAVRARASVDEAVKRLDWSLSRRDELRGRLTGYQSIVSAGTGPEDLEAAARFQAAHRLLHKAPCDLAACEQAVESFLRYVDENT